MGRFRCSFHRREYGKAPLPFLVRSVAHESVRLEAGLGSHVGRAKGHVNRACGDSKTEPSARHSNAKSTTPSYIEKQYDRNIAFRSWPYRFSIFID
ncbi:hypothetical protein AUC45_07730 [Erythrobacter sp. YT30]|nr:hypothetical protein AUC45_07730 [Erythrobacter sp. YT30]